MTFRLYTVDTGGVPVHTEAQMVALSNGVFAALLGTAASLAGVPFDVPYFLGVTVAGDAEMTRRQPLAASPYAIRAATADKLGAGGTVAGSQVAGPIAASQLAGVIAGATVPGSQVTGSIATATLPAVQITGTLASANFAATQLLPIAACASSQYPKWNGSAWACADAPDSLAGTRTLGPCVWTGSAVNCSGTCQFSSANGSISCDSVAVNNCTSVTFGSGQACPSSGACALSCVDSITPKAGFTFADNLMGSRTITIPPGGSLGRLSVHIRSPVLVCTFSAATAFRVPVSLYLYKGGAADPSLILWQGTVLTNGGASGARDYVAEVPALAGEADVVPGATYSLWVSAGPISGNSSANCYLARSSSSPNNVILRYTPIKATF